MEFEDTERVIISDLIKLCADISSLYLNPILSDINIIVDGETLPAHSVILAVRSKHFKEIIRQNPKQNITIEDVSIRAFKVILKYIYSGSIKLGPADIKIYSEILKLAHLYSFDEFKGPLSENFRPLVNFQNVYTVLNEANLYGLDQVRNDCYDFIENHLEEFAVDDDIVKMTQKSMVNLLKRDTLLLPEHAIFDIVIKWRKANVDFDDLVLNSVDYSQMTTVDIISTVYPSKALKCEALFDALAQINDLEPKTSKGKPIEINVATPELGAKVLTGSNTEMIINGNNNFENWSTIVVGDKTGCIIELGKVYLLNYIRMRLYDGDNRHFKYYVEVSVDKSTWKKIVDYSTIPTRSIQHLYFKPERVKFVRVVGIHSSLNNAFHIIFFEAYYKLKVPKMLNGVIRPTKNVAIRDMNAIVISGIRGSNLIDGDYKVYNGTFGYSSHKFGTGPLIVELAQPYLISNLKLLLWDKDPRTYSFYIETSVNNANWQMAVDRRNIKTTGWQEAEFDERVVVFIRITGTFVSNGDGHLHCIHLECPASKSPQ